MKSRDYILNGMELRVIYGAKDVNVDKLFQLIDRCDYTEVREPQFRIMLQKWMDDVNCPVAMLINGNCVWPYNKTMRDFRKVVNNDDTSKMTNHLYKFFNLCCGTIAHYDKYGWSQVYSDNRALRSLFKRNEYGRSVVNFMPGWKTDAIRIAKDMEEILERGCV